jgi:hypothetical protein
MYDLQIISSIVFPLYWQLFIKKVFILRKINSSFLRGWWCSTRGLIQGHMLGRQVLYHLSHSTSPFWCWVFQDRVSRNIFWGWLQIMILLISASRVVRFTSVNHLHPTTFYFFFLLWLVVYLRNYFVIHILYHKRTSFLFSHKEFYSLALMSKSDPFWVHFHIWYKVRVQLHSFPCGRQLFPSLLKRHLS